MRLIERGDTIIEVLLAFTVFSLLSVGTMTVMNQGSSASQRALEITLVRQQIDAQAEALRAAQQAYAKTSNPADSEWRKFALTNNFNRHYTRTDRCPVPDDINLSSGAAAGSFIMNPTNGTAITTSGWYGDINTSTAYPYAQMVSTTAYGIWIERTFNSGEDGAPNSFDFDVRACWFGAGLSTPMQIETSVRLYEPRT